MFKKRFYKLQSCIVVYLVNLSLGFGVPYPESPDAVAVQRVSDAGGKNCFFS